LKAFDVAFTDDMLGLSFQQSIIVHTLFKHSTSPPSSLPSFTFFSFLFGVIRIMFGAGRWVGWGGDFVCFKFLRVGSSAFVTAAYSARFVPLCSVPVSHYIFLRLLVATLHRTRVLYRAWWDGLDGWEIRLLTDCWAVVVSIATLFENEIDGVRCASCFFFLA